jgi:predicted regulator of Ras-like GTPase activity (Roadblock/LC7/MglB family)
MNETKISEALEQLRERLPERPDWIALVNIDGLFIAGTNLLPDKNRASALSAALEALNDRAASELGLGRSSFNIVGGRSGLLLLLVFETEYLVSMKFGDKTSFSALSILAKSLPGTLHELAALVKEYSP